MVPQVYSWTCSICSLDWLLKSSGLDAGCGDVYTDRYDVGMHVGYPDNVNAQVGLMDASGSALRAVLDDYGQPSSQGWLDFDSVYALAQETVGIMSGANWYHWVGIRGTTGNALAVANSAPGYKGIWDVLTREDFNRLGGFSVVWLSY